MPVQIGAQTHSFSDPTGLLSDCHRRIEMFLRALERVASVIDRPLTEDIRHALESALRYFREDAAGEAGLAGCVAFCAAMSSSIWGRMHLDPKAHDRS
jgi:hypothetical protein